MGHRPRTEILRDKRELAERALALNPPNLKGTTLMREDTRQAPVNLEKLDRPARDKE
jgi:hypothetical protein